MTTPKASALLDSLRRLDLRLIEMTEAAHAQTGREPGADPFRGLYITEADLAHLLNAPDAAPSASQRESLAQGERFDVLADRFHLSAVELDALLLALAGEADLRYQRIFAYLQDDVNRRRPSIDLALAVLGPSGEGRFRAAAIFHALAPLRKNALLRIAGDDSVSWSARELHADCRLLAFLAGEDDLDERLSTFVSVANGATNASDAPGLLRLIRIAVANGSPLRACIRGRDEHEKRSHAYACASKLGMQLLIADLALASKTAAGLLPSLEILFREIRLRNAIVLLEGLDDLAADVQETFWRALAEVPGIAIISTTGDVRTGRTRLDGFITIPLEQPEWTSRRSAWRRSLQTRGSRPRADVLDSLAESFLFGITRIDDAAAAAAKLADYRGERFRSEHVFEAARMSTGRELAAVTNRVEPVHGWDDIVLPDDALSALREVCLRVERRRHIFGAWGFESKLSGGKGINALFHGHSGTGKTMAAEVVARELHLDLYKIDLAGVVSKYIGETEKNLDRIFTTASDSSAILFFDEADALFGKRSEVRDSHDRYANLEISYLLQKMEQYEGVSILATNLRQNLDDAFLRRLTFTIAFPFPDQESRRKIWQRIWPEKAPVAPDIDAAWLGSRFLLSGGNIRNVALAAAFLAADDGRITLRHVLRAIEAEFRKMGRNLSEAELMPTAAVSEVAA